MGNIKLESKYFEHFKRLKEKAPNTLVLRGSTMLVEVLDYEVKSKSGSIIIAQASNQTQNATHADKGVIAMVLAVGPGYYNPETGASEPMDIKPGALILVSPHSLLRYSYFPGLNEVTSLKLALTKESEVRLYYEDLESFATAEGVLNE